MDFGLIALCLTVAHIVLSYVAPKTKTTADDKALKAVDAAKGLLPGVSQVSDALNAKKPSASAEVKGFGMARDHRK
jgi:hypothetical protein